MSKDAYDRGKDAGRADAEAGKNSRQIYSSHNSLLPLTDLEKQRGDGYRDGYKEAKKEQK